MALLTCPDCKQPVSSDARRCPKCSAKVRPPKKPMSLTFKILLALGSGLFVVALAFQQMQDNETTKAEQQRVASLTPEQLAREHAQKALIVKQEKGAVLGAVALRDAMKDPEGFVLRSLILHPNGTACYEYRAKNAFGATFPSSAVLTSSGKILVAERDRNAFVSAWNKDCTKDGARDITNHASCSRLIQAAGVQQPCVRVRD
jgi:hypothetical protein